MRFRHLGTLLAFVLVVLASGLDRARADLTDFHCPQPWAEIALGEFIHEFPTTINSTGGDSVDIIVNAVLPSGWFWQVCQVSSGICYFANTRVWIEGAFEPDILRVDFFPNTSEPGVGYLQLEVRRVDDPTDSRYCTYTIYNGVPAIEADFRIDCSDNTVYAESGATIHEFFAPITNTTAFDDSVHVTPILNLPPGWFSQFCQVSTGVCYFSDATIPLPAGIEDVLRIDFFPSSDGFGQIKLDLFSVNNPSIFRKCAYTVFQGEDGFPTSVPEGFGLSSNVASSARPNPFDLDTSIRFHLDAPAFGDLSIFSAEGREVWRLGGLALEAGEAEVRWDGRDARGQRVSSGVYFYRLQSGTASAKGILVKAR